MSHIWLHGPAVAPRCEPSSCLLNLFEHVHKSLGFHSDGVLPRLTANMLIVLPRCPSMHHFEPSSHFGALLRVSAEVSLGARHGDLHRLFGNHEG